jgi:hypothetical protein
MDDIGTIARLVWCRVTSCRNGRPTNRVPAANFVTEMRRSELMAGYQYGKLKANSGFITHYQRRQLFAFKVENQQRFQHQLATSNTVQRIRDKRLKDNYSFISNGQRQGFEGCTKGHRSPIKSGQANTP